VPVIYLVSVQNVHVGCHNPVMPPGKRKAPTTRSSPNKGKGKGKGKSKHPGAVSESGSDYETNSASDADDPDSASDGSSTSRKSHDQKKSQKQSNSSSDKTKASVSDGSSKSNKVPLLLGNSSSLGISRSQSSSAIANDEGEMIESVSETMQQKMEEMAKTLMAVQTQLDCMPNRSKAGRPKGSNNNRSRIVRILQSELLSHDVAGLEETNPLLNQSGQAFRNTRTTDPMIIDVMEFLDQLLSEHGTTFPGLNPEEQVYMGHPTLTLSKLPEETIVFLTTAIQVKTDHMTPEGQK
jgi:hypothetical protein